MKSTGTQRNHYGRKLLKSGPTAILLAATVLGLLVISGCTRPNFTVTLPTVADGQYDSEFPYRHGSKELGEIAESVMMVNCIAYYRSYVFAPEARLNDPTLTEDEAQAQATEKIFYSRSASGTATCLFKDASKFALLTCAHIVDFPETIVTYYKDRTTGRNISIQSIAYKDRQSNYIAEHPACSNLQILLLDEKLDIAIIGKTLRGSEMPLIPVFSYPLGSARELNWGNFVYLAGFPRGQKMMTTAIVSDPNRDRFGSFLVDAAFNRGFSGGLVLALRDGIPNFELVGIAKSAAAEYLYLLTPPSDFDQSMYDPNLPYNGELRVEYRADIQYGVTNVVPIESILVLLKENEDYFDKLGYNFRPFYKPPQ